jgi:hypothetical protein
MCQDQQSVGGCLTIISLLMLDGDQRKRTQSLETTRNHSK